MHTRTHNLSLTKVCHEILESGICDVVLVKDSEVVFNLEPDKIGFCTKPKTSERIWFGSYKPSSEHYML